MGEKIERENIELCGQVKWATGTIAGYIEGLEELTEKNISFKKCGPVYFFCRDVMIAIANPGGEQQDVVKSGQKLVRRKAISQDELDYIYSQFGFNPEKYKKCHYPQLG